MTYAYMATRPTNDQNLNALLCMHVLGYLSGTNYRTLRDNLQLFGSDSVDSRRTLQIMWFANLERRATAQPARGDTLCGDPGATSTTITLV